jgi:hypothetical protein
MTTYHGSALTNGQSIAFNPAQDVLHFDGDDQVVGESTFRHYTNGSGALPVLDIFAVNLA